MSMNSAGSEITRISKAVSDFSLMLKQVALAMEQNGEHESTAIASGLAVDTVFDIKQHSDLIFRDIKSMTDLSQFRDESGQLTEIGVGRKVSWTLKHSRVPYLLGQLEYLKLNLAIILQILQLAESIRHSRYVRYYCIFESAAAKSCMVSRSCLLMQILGVRRRQRR